MRLVLYLLGVTLTLVGLVQAQCPSNTTPFFTPMDRDIIVPLTQPICIFCRFNNPSTGIGRPFSDGVWTNNGNPLTNGSFNGNVSLTVDSNTMYLTMAYPAAVISVGDTIRCTSASLSAQHIITVKAYIFLPPTVSPNGTVNIIEGRNQILNCSNPGNTGSPRYVWINESSGEELTVVDTTPPLSLTLTNINRTATGEYICRSTVQELPGVNMDSTVTINVQYLDTPVISPLNSLLPRTNSLTINCSYVSNPPVNSVIWYHNGSILNTDSLNHITVNDQTSYTELMFSPLSRGLMDSGEYFCTVSNTVLNSTSPVSTITVQVNPDPVMNLAVSEITTNSVRLSWSLGFNGNAPLSGGTINYTAVANGNGTGLVSLSNGSSIGEMVTSLQPFTNYSFTVFVTNVAGNSISVTEYAQTLPLVPTAPRLDSVTPINSTALSISWTNKIVTLTQSMVVSYRVVYTQTEGGSPVETNVTAPTTSFITPPLLKGTRYTVVVYATNSAGESTVSNSVTARTNIDPPSPVTSFSLTPFPDSICVSWAPPTDNGGQSISGYRVYVRNNTTPTFTLHSTLSDMNTSVLLMPLSANTQYSVIVSAVNMEGGEGMNSTQSVQTGSPFGEENDADLMIDETAPSNGVTALTATLTWDIPSSYKTIRLQYRINGSEWSNLRQLDVTGRTSYQFTELTPETMYEARLILRSAGSCLQRVSNTATFTTLELQVIVNSSNTTVTAGDLVTLVCNLDTGGAPPSSVTWTYNGMSNLPDTASVSGNILTLTDPNVENSGNYTCSFRDTFYTFPLIINPRPTTPPPETITFPMWAIYVIAGVVGAIIVVFLIVLIIVICCMCCKGEKDITKTRYNFKKNEEGGMWLDEGASGFAPTSTYRPTNNDHIDYPSTRGRSLTSEFDTATSFDTLDKGGKGSKEKLTTNEYEYPNVELSTKRPYDDRRIEYGNVGSSTFADGGQSRQSDV